MPLRNFITELESRGELHRIAARVSPDLELATITDRVCKSAGGGTALLFEQVAGTPFPVATNLFGSAGRIALALGSTTLDDFGRRLFDSLGTASGQTAAERLQNLLADDPLHPVPDSRPACRDVITDGDLSILPALRFWPQETLPSLTLPLVVSVDPDSGEQNCGMYRVQLQGPRCATVNFGERSGGAEHLLAWRKKNRPMPVAIVLGGDPALIWAAGAPLPAACDERHLAAWASGRKQGVTAGLSIPLQVPAAAELVIEGVVYPGETRTEGPFGNHTGGYVRNPAASLLQVTAISHRTDALCPSTLVGPPPMEDCYLAKASEQLLLALLKSDYPQVRKLHQPLETIFHGCALLAVEGVKGKEGRELLQALRDNSPLQRAKLLVLLDADIDISNPSLSFWRTINQLEEGRLFADGGMLSIDATGVDPDDLVRADRETAERIDSRWHLYGLD